MARWIANSAFFTQAAVFTHLFQVHLVQDVFAVATFRELPGEHPLRRLLDRHYFGLVPINQASLNGMLGECKPATNAFGLGYRNTREFLKMCYSAWKYDDADFELDLKVGQRAFLSKVVCGERLRKGERDRRERESGEVWEGMGVEHDIFTFCLWVVLEMQIQFHHRKMIKSASHPSQLSRNRFFFTSRHVDHRTPSPCRYSRRTSVLHILQRCFLDGRVGLI